MTIKQQMRDEFVDGYCDGIGLTPRLNEAQWRYAPRLASPSAMYTSVTGSEPYYEGFDHGYWQGCENMLHDKRAALALKPWAIASLASGAADCYVADLNDDGECE